MTGPRTVERSRVASAVLAVLLVTVAALGYRLSSPDSEDDLVRTPLDSAVAYQSGTVRVTDVRVGTTLQRGDDRLQTPGLFVVVRVVVQASGRDGVLVSSCQLRTRSGATYDEASVANHVIKVDPGFETSRDYAFEVDPARIDDLTFELWNKGTVFRYYERVQTPLGITAANAAQWARAGAGRTLVLSGDDVVRGLP